MDIQNMLQFQMQQYYSTISLEKESSAKVRNWAITIWGSYIALIASGKLHAQQKSLIVILLFIVLIFWFLDAIHHSVMSINEERILQIEKSISECGLNGVIPSHYFHKAGYPNIKLFAKVKKVLWAMFLKETVMFFHVTLVVASCLIVWFFPFSNNSDGSLIF